MSQEGIDRRGGELFQQEGQDGLLHRAFLRGAGHSAEEVRRSPVIGIASTASELNPCNQGLSGLAGHVKAGITAAGGLPLEFPTISISEPFSRPTSMVLRNLLSMDVEEMINAAPLDGVVLLGGCDKTIPAQIMGAVSGNIPALILAAGHRPVSKYQGNDEFTVDDIWPVCEARRIGDVDDASWAELEASANVGVGTCNVMGTATTMAVIAEVLGFAPPGSSLPSAASKARMDIARLTGEQIVEHVQAQRLPAERITLESLENAFRVVAALGGSTNALIHLEAIAGRAGLRIGFDRFREWSNTTELLANVRPTGDHLLDELERAGGVVEVMRRLGTRIHPSTPTSNGTTWGEVLAEQPAKSGPAFRDDASDPAANAGLRMLRGNLAPEGCVMKLNPGMPTQFLGKAIVFDGLDDLQARIDDPTLEADENSILVLRGLGVRGAPGMPEVGHIPIPEKLQRRGVTDLLRISDARMSGTSTGSVVLHVSPEAAVGGPLAQLNTGDTLFVDAIAGTIEHRVPADEFERRPAAAAPAPADRGYRWLFQQYVSQPHEGCDFTFLESNGAPK
jgi:dihydroxy-acid dehydratase